VQRFLTGGDPYRAVPVGPFLYPPWLLPLLVPLYWLGTAGGDLALKLITVGGLAAVGLRLKRPWAIPLVALSYPFLYLLFTSNADGFVLWGLALGGPVGLFFLSIKPQVAGLVGALWAWQAYKDKGWRGVAWLVAPTAIIAGLMTLLYPQWVHAMFGATQQAEGGTLNLWPWLVPAGLAALAQAFRTKRPSLAALATNLLTPYLRANSYVGALALVAGENLWLGAVCVAASWLLLPFVR
jgi:hypothetical protein